MRALTIRILRQRCSPDFPEFIHKTGHKRIGIAVYHRNIPAAFSKYCLIFEASPKNKQNPTKKSPRRKNDGGIAELTRTRGARGQNYFFMLCLLASMLSLNLFAMVAVNSLLLAEIIWEISFPSLKIFTVQSRAISASFAMASDGFALLEIRFPTSLISCFIRADCSFTTPLQTSVDILFMSPRISRFFLYESKIASVFTFGILKPENAPVFPSEFVPVPVFVPVPEFAAAAMTYLLIKPNLL
jgi:hypothetical protein